MTMPTPDDERDVQPVGGEVAPPADPESQGGRDEGPASGIAGPSYPSAESEPDAHR
ncbi:hypothetical protein ACI79C_19515 [Geodermatophilus sp. SYSU D00697]